MNKIQVLSAIFILASASGQVMADDYQLETGVSSWNYNAQGYHASELQLDLKYFFSPVSIEDRPLAVAYFLGRNSNLYGYGFSNIVNIVPTAPECAPKHGKTISTHRPVTIGCMVPIPTTSISVIC